MRKRDKIDYNMELEKIFEAVKTGGLNQPEFNEQIRKLFEAMAEWDEELKEKYKK